MKRWRLSLRGALLAILGTTKQSRGYGARLLPPGTARKCAVRRGAMTRMAARRELQRLQHRIGVGDLELAGGLDIERLDDAVIHQHRITLRARAEPGPARIEFEPDRAREVAAAVGQHHDLVAAVILLAPSVHHKMVVDRDAGDRIDALGLQIARLVEIAG